MKNIIVISPWAQKLRDGKENPKNYPFWGDLVALLKYCGFYTIQIGIAGEKDINADEKRLDLSFEELEVLIKESFMVITVDSFVQHFSWYLGVPAIVLWGRSDPEIFGHKENINILKDRKYLRKDQFRWWEDVEYSADVFVPAEAITLVLFKYLSNRCFGPPQVG